MTSKPIILVVGLLVALGSQISVVSDPKPQSSNNAALGPINQSETINHSTPCPIINVEHSANQRAGENISFKVVVDGGARSEKVKFKWKVSAGKVIKGQGAETITVSTRNVRQSEITGRVKVGGFLNPSTLTASCSRTLVK